MNKNIHVTPPIQHCKPDIVVWNIKKKECTIIDICVPLDVNVEREKKIKRDRYLLLASRLQRLYSNFTYKVVPIVLGATGFVPKTLISNIQDCGITKEQATRMVPALQRTAMRGSMKIVKSALKLK